MGDSLMPVFFLQLSAIFTLTFALDTLLQVQTVFRHGARAPIYEFTSNESRAFYFRGLGQLSDLGIVNGFQLGELFHNRYVKNGFLHEGMKPEEIHFRSSPKERCLMTAQEVGRGMFRKEISVPVFTYPDKEMDQVLYPRTQCEYQLKFLEENFGTRSWPEVFDKLTERFGPTVHGRSRDYLEAIKVEKYENLPVAEWANTNKVSEEIDKSFYEFLSVVTGVGQWGRPDVILTKSGLLLNTIHEDLKKAWRCHTNATKPGDLCPHLVKFFAYSTHDTVVLPLVESLGVLPALNGQLPQYASGLIFELWDRDGSPFVKVYYRFSPQTHDLLDVTDQVRNCGTPECDLVSFASCCDKYKIDDISRLCDEDAGFGWTTVLLWLMVLLILILLVITIFLAIRLRNTKQSETPIV